MADSRGSAAGVVILAVACVFTPQIREPITEFLGVNASQPFEATERYVAREIENLETWIRDLGRPFGG